MRIRIPEAVGSNYKTMLAAILGNMIWGVSYLFTRIAQRTATPEVVLSVRFTLAFLFMNLLMLSGRWRISFRGKRPGALIALGIMEPLYFYFESYGILYTNSTFVGVLISAVPLLSMFFAAFFLHEYPTRRQALFCLMPVAGVVMITVSGNAMGVVQPLGLCLVLCACLTAAAYRTINRKSAEAFSPFERTYIVLLICSVVFTLSALVKSRGDLDIYTEALREPSFLLATLMLSVFCSVAANMLVNYAAGNLSVVKLSTFGALTTLCSMIAGVLFLHEPISVFSLAGTALIVVGVWQVTRLRVSGRKS